MEMKKISFGFSKVKTKTNLLQQRQEVKEKPKVEYITSFDKNEKKAEPEKPPELVIPVKTNYTVAERIIAKKRKQEEDATENDKGNEVEANTTDKTESSKNDDQKSSSKSDEVVSMEALAIQEILEDCKKTKQNKVPTLSISMNDTSQEIEPAPNNVDYDSIPVTQFGYAMLRGMGWAPGKGIGKKQKVVEVVDLTLRPRGLGLGAEQLLGPKAEKDNKRSKT